MAILVDCYVGGFISLELQSLLEILGGAHYYYRFMQHKLCFNIIVSALIINNDYISIV